VRYVRNITDVGHLENETLGEGEDRIERKPGRNRSNDGGGAEICETPTIKHGSA